MKPTTAIYLRQWRLARSLSQTALAKRSGIPQPALCRLETSGCSASLTTLIRLAEALRLKPGDLLTPPDPSPVLSREAIDAVAQAVVSGERRLRNDWNRLADAAAHLASQKLSAAAVAGRQRNRGWRWASPRRSLTVRQRFGDRAIRQILHRVDRLLVMQASP